MLILILHSTTRYSMKRVAFALILPILYAATAMAQYTFVRTEREGGKSSTTQGFVDGTKFRYELEESKTVDNPQGAYVLSLDGGRTIYMVDSARREFARVDTQTLMGEVKEQFAALKKQTSLQIESPKVETILTEAGEELDGHATRHYKVRISYSMHFLKTDTRRSYVEYQDLWMASDIEQQGASKLLRNHSTSRSRRSEEGLQQIPEHRLMQCGRIKGNPSVENCQTKTQLQNCCQTVRNCGIPLTI
jgi:hypothetical protein